MTNGFALNHDKNLQIYFFCVKRQAKNDFLKDVERTVVSSDQIFILIILFDISTRIKPNAVDSRYLEIQGAL